MAEEKKARADLTIELVAKHTIIIGVVGKDQRTVNPGGTFTASAAEAKELVDGGAAVLKPTASE